MVVRLFWATMGPSSDSREARTSPSGPVVGSSTVPAGAADGEAEGDGLPDAPADGLAEAAGDGLAEGAADGLADGAALVPALADGERRCPGRPGWRSRRQGQRRDRGRLRRLRLQADGEHGPDLDEAGAGRQRGRLEAVLGEDRLDLVGRDGRVLELDLPPGPPGVVDAELEAGVRERGQEDEDQPRDREDQRERVEPPTLADDVKHARQLRGGWRAGPSARG